MGNEQQKQQQMAEYQRQQQMMAQQQAAANKKQQEREKAGQMQIKSEQTVVGLNAQITKIDDLLRKKEAAAENLENRVKELIAQGKKNEAKAEVGTLKTLTNEVSLIRTRRAVLVKQKNQLEMASIDINMAHVMGQANEFMKETGDINDRMQNVMLDQKEIQMQMAETNDIMKQIANNEENEEEEDQMFKQFEKQVNQDKARQITQQLNAPIGGVKVPAQVVQQQQQVRPQQMYAPSVVASGKKVDHMDDIERMLNS